MYEEITNANEFIGLLKLEWDAESIKIVPNLDDWKKFMLDIVPKIIKDIENIPCLKTRELGTVRKSEFIKPFH